MCGCLCYWRGAQASTLLEGSIPGLPCSRTLICIAVSMCTFALLPDHQETRVIQPCPCLNFPSLPDQVLPSHYDLQALATSSPVLGLTSSHPYHIHTYTLLEVTVCSYSASLWAFSHSFLFLDSFLSPRHLLFTQYSLLRTLFPYPPPKSPPLHPAFILLHGLIPWNIAAR